MGWITAIITMAALVSAIYLLDKKPNLSLTIAIIIPFVCFYLIGRLDGGVIFTFFAAIFVVIMNVLNQSKIED
ncbi:hypothetical protein GCM10007063_01200 [Lentibacillus kapialis]|uniref:Uncharacterized protein n=1 Tax=Lentibacillus kapialis TaxID=340214 RepID=A0A917USS0_9BACI|nr:hypothetical protein [Lentibacillus kapialis]GGJ82448.1 hypothetical protein GCM10007063_01200 [Lentibacillus kapialis]